LNTLYWAKSKNGKKIGHERQSGQAVK